MVRLLILLYYISHQCVSDKWLILVRIHHSDKAEISSNS